MASASSSRGTSLKTRKRKALVLTESISAGSAQAKPPRAEAILESFLRKAPRASEWRAKQIELDLKTAEQYSKVIRSFGNVTNASQEGIEERPNSGDELVDLAERLALLTRRSLDNAKLQRSVAHFQALILLSYCVILRERHVAFQRIDSIIDANGDKERKSLLNGALWINQLIQNLACSGWTIYRATELFFLHAVSLHAMSRIKRQRNLALALNKLKSDAFIAHGQSECLGTNFTISGLISSLLSQSSAKASQLSIEEISLTLGYQVQQVPQSFQNIDEVRAVLANNAVRFAHSNLSCSSEPHSSPMVASAVPCRLQTTRSCKTLKQSQSINNATNDAVQDLSDEHETQRPPQSTESVDLGDVQTRDTNPDSFVAENSLDRLGPTVSHSLTPPQSLLVTEKIFQNVKVYFENSCKDMVFDEKGMLLNKDGAELRNDLCNDFDSYCFTATIVFGQQMNEELRLALNKACALVERILRARHPRTLACFLEVLIHLCQTGFTDIASYIREYIKNMAVAVIEKGDHWGQICQLLGELEKEGITEAMGRIWECATDTLESELGNLSPLAICARLDRIKRVYGYTNYLKEERVLKGLAESNDLPKILVPRTNLNLAHNLNRQGRHHEAKERADSIYSLLSGDETYAGMVFERIECQKIVSHSQFNQGDCLIAIQTMREAITMTVDHCGDRHPWVLEFTAVLTGWLRREIRELVEEA